MDSTRRSFLKGLGLATAGLILLPDDLPRRFWALGAPLRLWGDGIHDDAPALQALIAGRWSEVLNAEQYVHPLKGGGLMIGAGRFRIEKTLRLRSDNHILAAEFNGPIEPFLEFESDARGSSVMYSRFVHTDMGGNNQ